MTDHLFVDAEYLDGFVVRIDEATAEIENLLASLDKTVRTLSSQWTGAASTSYAEAHAAWTEELAAMNAVLRQLSKAVKLSNDDYRDIELRNAGAWK